MIKYTYAADDEGQSLQSRELRRSDFKQTSTSIDLRAGERLVFPEGIGGNKNESGSCDVIVKLSISMCHFLCLAADAPVSTIPAVVDRMVVVPYSMDSLIPQNSFEGEVPVIGLCNIN